MNGIIKKTSEGALQKTNDFLVKPKPEANFPATASITMKKWKGINAETEVAHLSQSRPSGELTAK